MKFDVVLTNPPFQNRTSRGRTPHKLWIDFTRKAFTSWLKPGGLLYQVSPASFQSPSNKVLKIMQENKTEKIVFDVAEFFPEIGSTFAYYAIVNEAKNEEESEPTIIRLRGESFPLLLDSTIQWLPVDFCDEAISIHRKVMFEPQEKLYVEHDYVTCHNSLLNKGTTLSKEWTEEYCFPVFHTNPQVWFSSIQQDWAVEPKILWTSSGYTKPFLDRGGDEGLGGTDLVYRVMATDIEEGERLLHNLNSRLIRYILSTARWSGFGNNNVFNALPDLPRGRTFTDNEMYELFGLSQAEREYVDARMA